MKMTLNGAKGKPRIFRDCLLTASDDTGRAVGIRQKVKINPEAGAHRLVVFAVRVARQAFPDRRPPAFPAIFKLQLLAVGNLSKNLIESLHK